MLGKKGLVSILGMFYFLSLSLLTAYYFAPLMSRCIKQCLFATTKEVSSNSISSKIEKQNAKLLIPNKFPGQKYQDCQPLASPLQLNNPNLPSKMAEHENETDNLSHLSRRVLQFVLFAYRASTKCSLQVLGDVVGVGEGHAGILKTLPLPSQLWTSYLL
jgi:hypothetical protein